MFKLQTDLCFSYAVCLVFYLYSVKQLVVFKGPGMLLPNIFWFFVFPFEPFLVSFALLSYSICGFRRGCTCLRMIYKQRSLLSFVLVSIAERAQETFSVLVNVSLC